MKETTATTPFLDVLIARLARQEVELARRAAERRLRRGELRQQRQQAKELRALRRQQAQDGTLPGLLAEEYVPEAK